MVVDLSEEDHDVHLPGFHCVDRHTDTFPDPRNPQDRARSERVVKAALEQLAVYHALPEQERALLGGDYEDNLHKLIEAGQRGIDEASGDDAPIVARCRSIASSRIRQIATDWSGDPGWISVAPATADAPIDTIRRVMVDIMQGAGAEREIWDINDMRPPDGEHITVRDDGSS